MLGSEIPKYGHVFKLDELLMSFRNVSDSL